MSVARPDLELDPCGCCEGAPAEETVENAPGLPALRYRIGTHASILRRMLHALPTARPDPAVADSRRPLANLTTRSSNDPTIALLDAAACLGDVLTFYQERIANEGYLRTATERRSLLELARAIGYELAPGVAAAVYLSFTVEDAPGAPGLCTLARGTAVQSVPPQDKLPQVFETSAEFMAYAEWNALRPRLTHPAAMAILKGTSNSLVVVLGPSGDTVASTSAETPTKVQKADSKDLYWLDPSQFSTGELDVVEMSRVYFTEAATRIAKSDLLLLTGKEPKDDNPKVETLVLRVAVVAPDPDRKRIGVDLEPLARPMPEAPKRSLFIPYLAKRFPLVEKVKLGRVDFNRNNVVSQILDFTWRERDLRAFVGIHRWRRDSLSRAANSKPSPPITTDSGAFAFREKLGFFGNNAPKWKSLPKAQHTKGDPYPEGWDKGDTGGTVGSPPTLGESRTIWKDSQDEDLDHVHTYLERPVAGLIPGSWIVITSPELDAPPHPAVFSLYDARESSRADYGMSGRAMGLTLADASGTQLTSAPTSTFRFRTSTAHAASHRLEFAELPIEDPVEENTTSIELDRMVLGLAVGQAIALTGERDDTPGLEASEIAFLDDVLHSGGRTTLQLRDKLRYRYVRSKLVINANVVPGTHGESVTELLGSGDGSIGNQRFTLKKPPLTYVSAKTPSGAASSLEVRVNGVRWDEARSLYDLGPNDRGYVVRIDDDARASVTFGDGVHGARLPSGASNVSASYRSGIGPDGEVDAGSLTLLRAMPLGLRGVSNALAAAGAEGPERLAEARRNAPLTVLTFERVVSLDDYVSYARTFPGIGKARGDLLWVDGVNIVHLTVAGATGGDPGVVLGNLIESIGKVSDPSQRFEVGVFTQRYFTCEAELAVDDRYLEEKVWAAVEARLQAAFSFEAREFAQSVTAAEVIKLIHEVPGVIAVNLKKLVPYSDQDDTVQVPEIAPVAVPAHAASWNSSTGEFEAAELLLINPVGIFLSKMKD
jgi:predicted phage baseplate assembly protein